MIFRILLIVLFASQMTWGLAQASTEPTGDLIGPPKWKTYAFIATAGTLALGLEAGFITMLAIGAQNKNHAPPIINGTDTYGKKNRDRDDALFQAGIALTVGWGIVLCGVMTALISICPE